MRYYWLSGRCSSTGNNTNHQTSQWQWNNEKQEPFGCYSNWIGSTLNNLPPLNISTQIPTAPVPPKCTSELNCMYYGRVLLNWRWKRTLCGTLGHFICEQNFPNEDNSNITCPTPPPPPPTPTDAVLLTAIILASILSLVVLVVASFFIGFSIQR